MKAGVWLAGLLCAASVASAAETAGNSDAQLCRGAYPVMLMTDMECRLYLQQKRLLQAQGNARALVLLKQQHDSLMADRAARCPCAPQRSRDDQAIVVAGDC